MNLDDAPAVQASCALYKRNTAAHVLAYNHGADTGEPLHWCPEGCVDAMPNQLPATWQEYLEWRKSPNFMDAFFV